MYTKRSRVFAICWSIPSSHKIRDVIRSSVGGGASSGCSGTRPTKTVPCGISLPIFSATRKRPVGVLKLPSSIPIPNRDVDTGYVRIGCSFSFTVSCWARIETWMLFIRIFLLATNFWYSVTIDMLMAGYHIAVVGATGAAGTELLRVLERRSFPVASLRPIGSARSVGKSVQFCGDSIPVEKLDAGSFGKIDIAFFSAGGDVSQSYVPIACQADAIAIDKSSAFRMDPHVPLVIPEINAGDVKLHRGVIANPNCTTTVMLMALYPLHKIFRVHRIFAATYQAVSGSGTRGVEELTRQTKTWAEDQESSSRRPVDDVPASRASEPNASRTGAATAFSHPIAFNPLP